MQHGLNAGLVRQSLLFRLFLKRAPPDMPPKRFASELTSIAQVIIPNPVLNPPFDESARHFYFDEDGITDEVVE